MIPGKKKKVQTCLSRRSCRDQRLRWESWPPEKYLRLGQDFTFQLENDLKYTARNILDQRISSGPAVLHAHLTQMIADMQKVLCFVTQSSTHCSRTEKCAILLKMLRNFSWSGHLISEFVILQPCYLFFLC